MTVIDLVISTDSTPAPSLKRVDFTYNDAGQFNSIARYSDLSGTQGVAISQYDYDAAGRLTWLEHVGSSSTLLTLGWQYDNLGRLTSHLDASGTKLFSYDQTGQMTSAGEQAYEWDENGNPLSADIDPGNLLRSDGVYDYTYDNEGNRLSKTEIATDYVHLCLGLPQSLDFGHDQR